MFCRVWVLQVSPPSSDVARSIVWAFDPTLGPPTYLPKHTYTLPKKSLVSALSAQICSLSANPAPLLLPVMVTGAFPAAMPAAPPAAAAAALSVRETPIASTPLKEDSLRFAPRFEGGFGEYRGDPLLHEKSPCPFGVGPNATAGSPSDTRPSS